MSRNDELKYHEIAGLLDISIKTVETDEFRIAISKKSIINGN